MLIVAPISTRNQFGQLLNEMGLTGRAVEIGTHRAEFAANFLRSWRGQNLMCVDPWNIPPGYEEQAKMLDGGANCRRQDYIIASQALSEFENRATTFVGTSYQAKQQVPDNSVDFVHVDGDHSLNAVYNDLRWWWPKIKSGGVLAGHDFICPGEDQGGWGQYVQPAAISFAMKRELDLHLVVEENGLPWTFYLIKKDQ